jgi:hypothetical protein
MKEIRDSIEENTVDRLLERYIPKSGISMVKELLG